MRGRDFVTALERLACDRELPESIRVDNGPEFTSKVLDQWAIAWIVVSLWMNTLSDISSVESRYRIRLTESAYALHRRQAYLNFDFHLPPLWVIHMVQYAHRNTGKKRHRDAAVF